MEHIEYNVLNITVEEQRQTNWLKVEKNNLKKTTLIRYLLQSDANFDADDLSTEIPRLVKLISRHSLNDF